MGKTFYNLSCEELCDLMCGTPEDDYEEENMGRGQSKAAVGGGNAETYNYDRFAGGNIEMKTYNKLPKYIQDSVIAVDSYNPREYGYNEPINYHIYYIDNNGKVNFYSDDGADFLANMRYWGKSAFGKVDDFLIPTNYHYNEGDTFERRKK